MDAVVTSLHKQPDAAPELAPVKRPSREEAEAAVVACFDGAFGAAGAEVVVEEFLEGEEASFFALCDGSRAVALASAQDHKRVGDGDTGPNTGGMGAYSPAPVVTDAIAARVMTEIVEPTVRDAVEQVLHTRGSLDPHGRTFVVLGAGAEMGPLRALLRWGATVAAIDLPRPDIWRRLVDEAQASPGRLLVPARPGEEPLEQRAGVNLIEEVGRAADWVADLPGPIVIGNYVYADGATNVRVSAAVDLLTQRVRGQRPIDDVALAFLATPTDVFAVPGEAVAASVRNFAERRTSKLLRVPLRTLTGGRLLQRNYRPGEDPGINDSVVLQQGPNYLLAKRLQRWRAATARAEGTTVSFKVAPPTRTRSVVKNRALAAAYAGAHRFGIEVFEPGTSNTLMAALLMHDLATGSPALPHPWQDEAYAAAHGGLWRAAYDPRSALGLAAILGLGSAR